MRSTSRQTPPPRGRQGQPRREAPRVRQAQPAPPVPAAPSYPEIDEPTRPLQMDVLQAGGAEPEFMLLGNTQPVPLGDALLATPGADSMTLSDAYPPRQGRHGRREGDPVPTRPRHSMPVMALAAMLGVLLVFGTGLFAYASKLLGDMRYDQNPSVVGYADATLDPQDLETPDPNETLLDSGALASAIPSQTAAPIIQGQSTYNILLLGLDTRDPDRFTGALSDVMMLVTLDTDKKTIKLTSFMRDIIIKYDDSHGRNRLNTAMVFGGPELTKQMLSQYFGVQVDNYAVINFWAFASVIDALGGVTVDITSDELYYLNYNIDYINKISKVKTARVRTAGSHKLTGTQAVAYMRIRHGNNGGDFDRTKRQRTVLTALTSKLKSMNVIQATELVDTLTQYVRTDMTQPQMIDVAGKLISIGGSVQVEQLRIPVDDSYRMGSVTNVGKGVLLLDFKKNVAALEQFLTN